MRDILEYCIGGVRRNVAAGTEVLHQGGRTGHLYVLIEGRLDVIRGDTVVASLSEPASKRSRKKVNTFSNPFSPSSARFSSTRISCLTALVRPVSRPDGVVKLLICFQDPTAPVMPRI